MGRLRNKLAGLLFRAGARLAPPPEPLKPYKGYKETIKPTTSAVVEATDTPQQWAPKQHGNVVIAEPLLMTKHRRGEL